MSKFWPVDSFGYHLFGGIFNLSENDFYLALVDSTLASTYDAWSAGTAYSIGDIRIPTIRNGHRYICVDAGNSHATTEPTWPTDNDETVPDNEVVWQEYGGDLCGIELWSEVSGSEVADGNGYTTGGESLTGLLVSTTGRVTKWDADDITFTALTKTFRTGWLYRLGAEGGVTNPVVGYIMFADDFSNKVISAVDFVAQLSSAGIYTVGS